MGTPAKTYMGVLVFVAVIFAAACFSVRAQERVTQEEVRAALERVRDLASFDESVYALAERVVSARYDLLFAEVRKLSSRWEHLVTERMKLENAAGHGDGNREKIELFATEAVRVEEDLNAHWDEIILRDTSLQKVRRILAEKAVSPATESIMGPTQEEAERIFRQVLVRWEEDAQRVREYERHARIAESSGSLKRRKLMLDKGLDAARTLVIGASCVVSWLDVVLTYGKGTALLATMELNLAETDDERLAAQRRWDEAEALQKKYVPLMETAKANREMAYGIWDVMLCKVVEANSW